MVDGALQPPDGEPPAGWQEIRLRTTAGMVTLKRAPGGARVVVFGNADATLLEAQGAIAEALAALAAGRPA